MRISKLFLVAVGMIWMAACSPDWGQHDPEAGNQTYPSREVVATYSFEYSDETPVFSDVDRTLSLKTCEVVEVDTFGSNVLHLDSGYVRINNPLNNVTLQDGAAITMWVNIANEDLEKALFSFGYDEEDSAKFYFTPNAQLVYSKPGQLESLNLNVNDPSSVKTNAIDADGQWHFIALQVADDGYQFYVDGELKANDTQQHPTYSTDFDYKTLLNHINNAPYLYIGAGADTLMSEVYYDDITIIRNHMQEKDYNKKYGSSSGGDESSKAYVTVGATDCSAGWWSEFSDYFTVPVDGTFHTKFINHTSGANNWNNWLLVATTDADRSGDGYSEYFVLRADAYGWGNSDYNGDNISSDFVWDGYTSYMEGAVVDMTVTRSGSTITMTTTTTTVDGTVYNYSYHQDNCGEGQTIRLFLTVEAAYLEIDPEETYIGETYTSGSKLVGSADCSATWWTAFSDFYSCAAGDEIVFHFINNNTGTASNWNNWLLVCSTTELNGDGYSEHFVLRADSYGWGNSNYNGDNITSGFDWTTYVSDMHGADCYVRCKYDGGTVNMDAKQKTAAGVVMPAYSYYQTASGDLGFFLTAELASLDLLSVGYYPYFDKIFETNE